MRRSLSLITASVILSCAASAQGTYKTLGSGCGAPGAIGYSENATAGTLKVQSLSNEYAYPVNIAATKVLPVTGVRFFTASVQGVKTVAVRIYKPDPKSAGQPDPKPLDTTKMTVGPKAAFWQANFNKVHIMKGQFWVSFDCVETFTTTTAGPAAVYASNLTSTAKTVSPVFWRRPPVHDLTWSKTGIITQPSYHVMIGGTPPALLAAKTAPTLGKPFQLDVSQTANGLAVAIFGFSASKFGAFTLPLDLKVVAPGCWIFQSLDILLPAATTQANGGKVILPIPNDAKLKNVLFFNQWMLPKVGGNTLNWVFSNGGRGTIG